MKIKLGRKQTGVLFMLLAVSVVCFSLWKQKQKDYTEEITLKQIQKEDREENTELNSMDEEASAEDEKAQEENKAPKEEDVDFDLQLTDEICETLQIKKEEAAKELKEWTAQNGYSGAVGAASYGTMDINFDEGKYSIDLQLMMEEGNNIAEEETIITMDYYPDSHMFIFH